MSAEENPFAASLAAPPLPRPDDTLATRLRGDIGVVQLVFTVLSYNAPLSLLAGVAPLVIAFGTGLGTPLLFLALGLLMTLFAVGYNAMSRGVDNPGAFYAYVSTGLGKPLGLGSSFVAMVSYSVAMGGALVFTGMAIEAFVHTTLAGPDIAWWVWDLLFAGAIGVLGYLKVDVSARVLAVLMSLEILIVLVWEAVVTARGGSSGHLGFTPFTPHALLGGSFGVGLVFAVSCFSGFEATAIFRDEARDPDRTIPRATYISIGVVTVFYALATWALVQAFGEHEVVGAIAADPTGAFFSSVHHYLGRVGYDITTALLITSAFAALVAYHNVVSRYLFNLGVDGVLPRRLGTAHGRLGSPHRASALITALTLLFVAVAALSRTAPDALYTNLIGISGYAFILLLVLASLGIAAHLVRKGGAHLTLWQRAVAPVSAAVLFCAVGLLCTVKIDVLTGSTTLSLVAAGIAFGSVGLGIAGALVLRSARPQVFARIGRQ